MQEFIAAHKHRFGKLSPLLVTDDDLYEWDTVITAENIRLLTKFFAFKNVQELYDNLTSAEIEQLHYLDKQLDIPAIDKYVPKSPEMITDAVIVKHLTYMYHKYINKNSDIPAEILLNAINTSRLMIKDIWECAHKYIVIDSSAAYDYNMSFVLLNMGLNKELIADKIEIYDDYIVHQLTDEIHELFALDMNLNVSDCMPQFITLLTPSELSIEI